MATITTYVPWCIANHPWENNEVGDYAVYFLLKRSELQKGNGCIRTRRVKGEVRKSAAVEAKDGTLMRLHVYADSISFFYAYVLLKTHYCAYTQHLISHHYLLYSSIAGEHVSHNTEQPEWSVAREWRSLEYSREIRLAEMNVIFVLLMFKLNKSVSSRAVSVVTLDNFGFK